MSSAIKRLLSLAACTAVCVSGQAIVAPGPASAGQVGVTVKIQGAGTTQVVEGSLEDGSSGFCSFTSNQDERVTNTCPRFRNEEVFEAWVWLRATPASFPSGHWRLAGWTGCDSLRTVSGHQECGVHSGAFSADERSPKAIFADDFAPTVGAITEAFSTTMEKRVTYFFGANEGQLQCRFDAETFFNPCSSGVSRTYPSEGVKSIDVRAVDASGQVSATSTRSVTVVDTALNSGPVGTVASRTAAFGFSSVAGTGFMCSLDSSLYFDCGSAGTRTFVGLSDGAHTFRVYARNGGWYDRIPAVRTWYVDATPPETTLATPVIDRNDATFTFGHSGGWSFECSLTGPAGTTPWQACTSPKNYQDLADGEYTFAVRARDFAGNVDPTPASHTWTVDTTAPNTSILAGPAHRSFRLATSATLGYGSTESGSSFACTLDGAARTCAGSTVTLSNLAHRSHVFTVAARDAYGNTDASPAQRIWTVPLNNTELTHGRYWTKRLARNAYLGSYSQTTRQGARLSEFVRGARKIALVAGTGPGHGSVRVYAGTRLLKTVGLAAATSRTKRLIQVTGFATPFTGTIKVVVASRGKVVRIEGLGVATR